MHLILSSVLSDPAIRLISFDVFDTVVTRKTGDPYAVFLLLGKYLYENGMIDTYPELFARQRYISEKCARRNNNYQEIQLKNIYNEMSLSHDLGCPIEELMEAEMRVEADQICAIPEVHQYLDKVRDKFGRLIFVSDMYLPKHFLEKRLKTLELLKPDDRLYVSSEFGLQKRHGLFKKVLEQEALKPFQLFHFGDSLQHDVTPANSLGIGVHHYRDTMEHPSEKILNAHSFQTEAFSSMMAGSARMARLKGRKLEPDKRTMWDTGSSVTGPLVLMYALWVIERARQKGIRDLWFLARDAYFPWLAVCSILDKNPQIDLNARYIYGSRVTYNALDIDNLGPEEWGKLTNHGGFQYSTIRDLQAALFCDRDVFEQHINTIGFKFSEWDRQLSKQEFERIRDHALTDTRFNNDIVRSINDFKSLTLEYFKNEGFDPDYGVALVDSGWTTKSHAPLYHFLEKAGCRNVKLFYMGLMAKSSKVPLDIIDTFMFNRASSKGMMNDDIYYPRPVESLFMTDHGRTRSFEKLDDQIAPVLDDIENPEFVRQYFEVYKAGLLEFLNDIIPSVTKVSAIYDHRSISEQIIARFWLEPSDEEVRVWSKLEWEWDPLGTIKYPLAKPYKLTDTRDAFLQGRTPERYRQFWRAGAEKLTPKTKLKVIYLAVYCRRLYARLIKFMPPFVKKRFSKIGGKLLQNI